MKATSVFPPTLCRELKVRQGVLPALVRFAEYRENSLRRRSEY